MRIETHASTGTDTQSIQALLAPLEKNAPDFMVIACSSDFELSDLMGALDRIDTAAVHGATSCLGVMTNAGMAGRAGNGIGYFAIWDEDGAFGSATAAMSGDAKEAAQTATKHALDRAGRPGEAPALIWVSASPGAEEAIISGIEDVVGSGIPIVGGSAADNTVAGNWAVFGHDGIETDGIQISVLFPSTPLAAEFQSGYAPSSNSADVTRSEGRRLFELNNRPAIDVYEELSGLAFERPKRGETGSILSQSSFNPLGLEIGGVSHIPYYLLMHAAALHDDGSIEFFADVNEGTNLQFMTGSADSLTQRAGRVATQTRKKLNKTPAGALVIYCAGCMLSVSEHMDDVAAGVDKSLDGSPFLGVFTFGEQGYALNQKNSHGNLMISCVTFSA